MGMIPRITVVTNVLLLATPLKTMAEISCEEAPQSVFNMNMPLLLLVALIGAGVGGLVARKRTPPGEVKLKVLNEIAKEYQVEWDTTESETELLKPPEKLIEGPQIFMSASIMPINATSEQFVQPVKPTSEQYVQPNNPSSRRYSGNGKNRHFNDTKAAADAAAESAKMAIAAAEAATYLANRESNQSTTKPHQHTNG